MNHEEWAAGIWEKLCVKLEKTAARSADKLPYISVDGRYNDMTEEKITWWTNGFFGGLMWLMYAGTGNELFRKLAEKSEKRLDKAFESYTGLHHDVGFMWHITAGADYKLTGNETSFLRNIYAANLLAGRYHIKGGYIRAWNVEDMVSCSIIDTMMNISQLYWASEVTGDNRYQCIAMAHADMAARCHVRSDGSVNHIVRHAPDSEEVVECLAGQGMDVNSSWSRGQAWALYGFALSYIHTGNTKYLDIAKRVAHYFIAAVCADYLPRCDFRSPAEPLYYDSTAGAIAACGLLEIANQVPAFEKDLYSRAAMRILKNMEENFCDWSEEEDAILMMGTEAYGHMARKNVPIIYGDYFFAEAIYKCIGGKELFW